MVIVQLLVAAGANINAVDDVYLLQTVAIWLRFLNVSQDGRSPAMFAAGYKHYDIVRYLVLKGANIQQKEHVTDRVFACFVQCLFPDRSVHLDVCVC